MFCSAYGMHTVELLGFFPSTFCGDVMRCPCKFGNPYKIVVIPKKMNRELLAG